MSTAYTPRADSLAARCINFFRLNPEEELTLEDIADKFDAVRGNIHTLLMSAREAGVIDRYRNADGDYVYKAGSKIDTDKANSVDIDAVHHGRTSTRFNAPAIAQELPDPMAVVIEDDVPLPGARQKQDWMPLLRRMLVKQSAALPLAARYTLSQAVTQAHKEKLGTFVTRRDADKNIVRVWRTA